MALQVRFLSTRPDTSAAFWWSSTESDIVNISTGAMMMYHKPMVGCRGNANDFKKQIDILDKIENENILKQLINRTGKPLAELMTLIENEW